jgi:hypothetical protein
LWNGLWMRNGAYNRCERQEKKYTGHTLFLEFIVCWLPKGFPIFVGPHRFITVFKNSRITREAHKSGTGKQDNIHGSLLVDWLGDTFSDFYGTCRFITQPASTCPIYLRPTLTSKMIAFWDIAPCSLIEVDRRFTSTNIALVDLTTWPFLL